MTNRKKRFLVLAKQEKNATVPHLQSPCFPCKRKEKDPQSDSGEEAKVQ